MSLTTGQIVFASSGDHVETKTLSDSQEYLRGGVKIYRALLTQSGTSAPTAAVLENSLGGTVVWSRNSEGSYSGTLTGAFPSGKTFVMFSGLGSGDGVTVDMAACRANSNAISVQVAFEGSGADGELTEAAIEVLVYP